MRKKLLITGLFITILVILTACSMAEHNYQEGKRSFEQGNYKKAAESFYKAIEENHNRADYYIDYGMTLIALGKYKEALSQFDHADLNKNMSIIRENSKRALRGKGIAYYHMQDYSKAVKEFDKALEINELPKLNVDILYYKGSTLRLAGADKKAIDVYNKILSGNKKNARAYAERANCYEAMGAYQESLSDYERAIKLEPGNYEYYLGKYELLLHNKDKAGAKDVLSQAAKIKIKTVDDRLNLAKIHYLQGNYDMALTELDDCIKDGSKEAYFYLGEIYRLKKDDKKAVIYYEKYMNAGAVSSSDVYNQVAVCLFQTGDYKKALKYLKQGIAHNDPGSLKALMKNEIIAYENLSRFSDAKEKIDEYLKAYPDDKDAEREAKFIKTRLSEAK